MYIIADSGATKTDWRAVDKDGVVRSAFTAGMNPSSYTAEHMASAVAEAMLLLNPDGEFVDRVFFYGAGLLTTAAAAPVRTAFQDWCPDVLVHFRSDLLAAARALFGDSDGIVAIMGTGSNSCLYRDGKIVSKYSSGGFILGDEGSAACLGKMLLSDLIKARIPLKAELLIRAEYDIPYHVIVENVYRKPGAAAYLGSFAPFVLKNIDEPTGYMRSLVYDCIDSFMKAALSRYDESGRMVRCGVVGSFGCACEEYVKEIGSRYGLEFVKFIKSPIEELVKYHGI